MAISMMIALKIEDHLQRVMTPVIRVRIGNQGKEADHKSLAAFQRELKAIGINLSCSKIRKIFITGGCWTTERSREIVALFDLYTSPKSDGGYVLPEDLADKKIVAELEVSLVTVNVNLPYRNVVYK